MKNKSVINVQQSLTLLGLSCALITLVQCNKYNDEPGPPTPAAPVVNVFDQKAQEDLKIEDLQVAENYTEAVFAYQKSLIAIKKICGSSAFKEVASEENPIESEILDVKFTCPMLEYKAFDNSFENMGATYQISCKYEDPKLNNYCQNFRLAVEAGFSRSLQNTLITYENQALVIKALKRTSLYAQNAIKMAQEIAVGLKIKMLQIEVDKQIKEMSNVYRTSLETSPRFKDKIVTFVKKQTLPSEKTSSDLKCGFALSDTTLSKTGDEFLNTLNSPVGYSCINTNSDNLQKLASTDFKSFYEFTQFYSQNIHELFKYTTQGLLLDNPSLQSIVSIHLNYLRSLYFDDSRLFAYFERQKNK